MAIPTIQTAFTVGEVAPSLFGRADLARYHVAASTFRNGFVNYRGGYYSRAGTAFVAFSKQTGRTVPPRMVPFQFNINQGLALEFGNFYMRVFTDGVPILEPAYQITGATQANPCTISYQSLSFATAVQPDNGTTTASYNRGDLIVPSGGTPVSNAQFRVNSTTLVSLAKLAAGTLYAVNDQITLNLAGGAASVPPVLTVTGIGGSGAITSFIISNGGTFTINGSVAGTYTQASTTGAGTGATFNIGVYGPKTLSIVTGGGYSAIPGNPASQGSTTGTGLGGRFVITWQTPGALANGDWVQISGAAGMVQLNGNSYVVGVVTPTTFQIFDVYNNPIDSTTFGAWTSGGSAARVYTLATPYAEADLEYLKFTQSADVMSLCCVNQNTNDEYPPLDLERLANNNWDLVTVVGSARQPAPTGAAGVASTSGSVDYQYQITAVDPVNGTESVASNIAEIDSAVNIAATAGSIKLTWTAVAGVNEYNVYKATPSLSGAPPVGALFGFAGSAYGTQFVDSNITADFAQVPPLYKDPFAPGQITGAKIVSGSASLTAVSFAVNSVTGTGAKFQGVIVGGVLVAIIVVSNGRGYDPSNDTVTITGTGGANPTATLQFGPTTGTYPSVPAYFQQRRGYAGTLNNPDTYWFSQPGSFTNFDSRLPTIDSDAITGSPWAVEVNGIQFMVPMPGGLIVMTGLSAWLLNGSGGSALSPQPLTPSTQSAQPQTYNGCSPTVPPIKIDNDVVYLQSKGSIYRRFNYQIYANIYTGEDITINSSHMFTGYTIREHAWCEEPYKVLWAVRSDGILLSATVNKPQEVLGWARSDTQGLFQSVCSVTEPPVDALYMAVQRFPGANTCYTIERMDNRIWSTVEDCWCVDCAIALARPQPAATITASSANGNGACTGVTGLIGGAGYSIYTTATVVDDSGKGPGTGAVPTLTIVNGIVTAVTFAPGSRGVNYVRPGLVVLDPSNSGSGASAKITLDTSADFATNADAFTNGNVGSVIRMGGGAATITSYVGARHVIATVTQPIVQIIPNTKTSANPFGTPQSQPSGSWSMTVPASTVSGLGYLAGATVTGLADGVVIPPTVVPASGAIALPQPSTSVVVGLGFQAQLQSIFLDVGEPTVQGQRKKAAAVTARIEASRGLRMGSNQVDGSTLSPPQVSPTWNAASGLVRVTDKGVPAYNSVVIPLYTGDVRIPLKGGFATPGQVCLQQDNPLPMNVLALIDEMLPGDVPQVKDPPPPQSRGTRQSA